MNHTSEAAAPEEHFDGDDLAEEMSQLDLSALPPPSLVAQKRSMVLEPVVVYLILAVPSYRSLNSIRGSTWDMSGSPSGSAPALPPNARAFGTGRTAKYRNNIQKPDGSGLLSTDLVNAIFQGITTRRGDKRLARLSMDDRSGRWHVVRYATPTEGLSYRMPGE